MSVNVPANCRAGPSAGTDWKVTSVFFQLSPDINNLELTLWNDIVPTNRRDLKKILRLSDAYTCQETRPSLVQVMAYSIPSNYLNQLLIDPWGTHFHEIWGPFCLSLNTVRPGQNDRHFPYDHLKCIFLNENIWISIKISLKFVPKGPINNNLALVQIMAWHRSGDKPLSEPMMVSLLTHICVTRPQWVNVLTAHQILDWRYSASQRAYVNLGGGHVPSRSNLSVSWLAHLISNFQIPRDIVVSYQSFWMTSFGPKI